MYDARFSNSHSYPGLPKWVPQGVAPWQNWDGSGRNVLLVTAYQSDYDTTTKYSKIYAIDIASGANLGTATIADSHVGGIAIIRDWVLITGSSTTVRRYRLTDLRIALQNGTFLVTALPDQSVIGSSFLNSYGDSLFTGTFSSTGRGQMREYKVSDSGAFTQVNGTWEIPTKTQGVMITPNHFIYSTSYGRTNRSNLYVVRRGVYDLDAAKVSCFRAPSMSEGIAEYNGTTYLVYESAAFPYGSDSTTLNVISRLHKASTSSLTSLVP
jgi:hypothetical protein